MYICCNRKNILFPEGESLTSEVIALPPGVVIDPFWDWAPEGLAFPVWLGVLIILMFLIIGPNLWWLYKFLVMRPVQGHGIAARAGNERTQQVLLFGLNRAFSIQAMDYLEKVLSFKDPVRIARWLQTSPYAVGMLGYKSIMLISEIFDHPKDPVAEMAIGVASRKHNEGITDMNDMIVDYKSFRDHRDNLEHENPIGVQIPIYALYDPGMIHQYTPENRTSGQFGRTVMKDANDLNMAQPTKTTWEKMIPVGVCLVFGIIAIVIVAWWVGQGNPPPTASPVPPALSGGV